MSSNLKPTIFGLQGPELLPEEKSFFRETNPVGFILFARNLKTAQQIKTLTDDLRACVGRATLPILIDQEGGRITRLPSDEWNHDKAPNYFGKQYEKGDPNPTFFAALFYYTGIAKDLRDLGITVNCVPSLDLQVKGAHNIIGDRAFSSSPDIVSILGRAVVEGSLAGGVLPVMKHLPGHGLAKSDSHLELPIVEAPLKELENHFAPFTKNNRCPWGMTAHILYPALDPENPATFSTSIIQGIIREQMRFEGFLLSDDLTMKALSGPLGERAVKSLKAGCDAIIHWNGNLEEMREIAAAVDVMQPLSLKRLERSLDLLQGDAKNGVI